MSKQRQSFGQIWNMNFAYLGIQFGWGLQMANMSAIYEYLGAKPEQIPILWLAAPLTGLLIQPIVGQMSDRTWMRWLGRRRPYLFFGAILSSLALLLMPNAPSVWAAAALLWMLDGSINVSMQPIRALVADLLPDEQHSAGYAMQSVFIGLGAVVASALPWMLSNWFGMTSAAGEAIPITIRIAFYVGAAAFLGAVVWTVFTTKEYPPEDLEAFRRTREAGKGFSAQLGEMWSSFCNMPATMKQLAWVQICTWMALFFMWMYFGPAIAFHVFEAPNEASPLYQQGIEWGGMCFAAYSVVTFAFAFILPGISRRLGRRLTHALCLICGALGLLAVLVIKSKWMLMASMAGVGIAWASILSMPYAIIASALPEDKVGVYMGIFNLFIVIPEIVASIALGPVMKHLFGNNRLLAVVAGGGFMLVAALLMRFVKDEADVTRLASAAKPQETDAAPVTDAAAAAE